MEEKIVEKSLYKAYTELKRFIAHEYSILQQNTDLLYVILLRRR